MRVRKASLGDCVSMDALHVDVNSHMLLSVRPNVRWHMTCLMRFRKHEILMCFSMSHTCITFG